jgi:uncharacterized protein (TIGR00369 family)
MRAVTDLELPAERHARLVEWFERGIAFNRAMGLHVDALARGSCVLRIPWRDDFVGDEQRAALHGGVTSMIADTAGGCACFTMLDRDSDRVATVDLRVDYLRPGGPRDVVCHAKIVRMGNRVAVARMEVFSGDPHAGTDPIATGQGVYNVVRRE